MTGPNAYRVIYAPTRRGSRPWAVVQDRGARYLIVERFSSQSGAKDYLDRLARYGDLRDQERDGLRGDHE